MNVIRTRLAALLIGFAIPLLGVQSASAANPTLYVHYTMSCTFTIVGDNGATISVIPPGTYQILVTSPRPLAEVDLSGEPDPNVACGGSLSFRLTGPGVTLHTTLDDGDGASDQLSAIFQVGGTYVAQEDRRPTVARLVITVSSSAPSTGGGASGGSSGGGSGGTSTTKTTTVPVVSGPVRGTLNGSVSTTGKLTLKFKGKTVSSLKAGRYKVIVLDEWSGKGFTIQKLGKQAVRLTGPSFVGRKTVTLSLAPGQWTFYSTAAKKSYFIVVG